MFVPEKKDYFKKIVGLVKKSKSKVCYVSLNKSCRSLLDSFAKNKIARDKVAVIDCISARLEEPAPEKGCFFASAPYEFRTVGEAISTAVKKGYTFVVFDSLSNLLIYGHFVPFGVDILITFIRRFLPDLKAKGGDGIFICNRKDRANLLIQESLPIFDDVKEVK